MLNHCEELSKVCLANFSRMSYEALVAILSCQAVSSIAGHSSSRKIWTEGYTVGDFFRLASPSCRAAEPTEQCESVLAGRKYN